MADDPVEVMAKAIHRAYQEPFPKFTHRELDDLDEATGVASRFRGMARASLAALQAEGMVIVRLPDLNNGEPTAARRLNEPKAALPRQGHGSRAWQPGQSASSASPPQPQDQR
jgi:hypothetical protein